MEDSDQEPKLVTVATFRDLAEALLAKGSLEASGVGCFLVDDNVIRMDWFWANALGGIKLKVLEADAETAAGLLSEPVEFTDDEADTKIPRCPNCGSDHIRFLDPDKGYRLAALWAMGIPTPRVGTPHWHCDSCNVDWVEDEEEEPQNGPRGEAGSPSSPERP